jgi:hypothetical protein
MTIPMPPSQIFSIQIPVENSLSTEALVNPNKASNLPVLTHRNGQNKKYISSTFACVYVALLVI